VRYPYPGGVGVPRLGRRCHPRLLLLSYRTFGYSAMSRSQRQRCQRGQRQSRLEKKLRWPGSTWPPWLRRCSSGGRAQPGRPLAGPPRSQVAEAMSRADVLGGQLAEATERPVEVSARARTFAETLAMTARAWYWCPSSRWRSFRPCRRPRPGQIPPKVETTPRVLLLPLLMSEPAGRVCL
jgi:hypothetical protein